MLLLMYDTSRNVCFTLSLLVHLFIALSISMLLNKSHDPNIIRQLIITTIITSIIIR